MTYHRRSSVFGWVLVLLGAILILNHWYHWNIEWTEILMVLGIGVLLLGIIGKNRGAVLPGTFLFFLGLFFYFKDHYIFIAPWWNFWPFVLLALGIAFVMQHLFDPIRRGGLIPGILLIAIAFWFLYFPRGLSELICAFGWIGNIWFPAVLIIVGLVVIAKSLKRQD